MTPGRDAKRLKRTLRTIPVEGIAPAIAADEASGDGLWCIIGADLEFVMESGGRVETEWDHALAFEQYVRWVSGRPERVHPTIESAQQFVRAVLAKRTGS